MTKLQSLQLRALKKAPNLQVELERMNHLFQYRNKQVLGRYTTLGDNYGIKHVVETWNPTKNKLEFHSLKEMKVIV